MILLVGVSRVYLGAHFLSDMLRAGAESNVCENPKRSVIVNESSA